jgi:hypothetical protein
MSRDGQFLVAYIPLESNPVEEIQFYLTHLEIKLRDGRIVFWEAENPVRLECNICNDCKNLSHFLEDGMSVYECWETEGDEIDSPSRFIRAINEPSKFGCGKWKRRGS